MFAREMDENVPPPSQLSRRREDLQQKDGQVVDVGIGVAEKSQSPELQFLFQSR